MCELGLSPRDFMSLSLSELRLLAEYQREQHSGLSAQMVAQLRARLEE